LLRNQVDELQGTIEGLNACFLTLTDTLTSSKLLKKDKIAVDGLRKAMQTFLELNRSCDNLTEDGEKLDLEATPRQYPELSELASTSWMNQLQSGSNRPNSETDSIHLACPPKVQISASQPHITSLSSPLRSLSTTHILSFAARLHQKAFQTGLYLASNAEASPFFHRIFKYALNSQTHQSLFIFLSKVVNENFGRLLEPPEARAPFEVPHNQFEGWLNATEVSQYFSQKGFDFDKPSLYVQIEIDEGYPNSDTDTSWDFLPWLQPMSQQARTMRKSQNMNLHSSTAYAKWKVVVDVTKLINSESSSLLRLSPGGALIIVDIVVPDYTKCSGRVPMFSQENLDNAVRQAVVEEFET
jgi:hypothetical protein